MGLEVQHDKAKKKFFTIVEGKECHMQYRSGSDPKVLEYYHTFVPPELRGRSIGDVIVKYALGYAKNNNFKVIPSCPFVQRIIDRNQEYTSLLAK